MVVVAEHELACQLRPRDPHQPRSAIELISTRPMRVQSHSGQSAAEGFSLAPVYGCSRIRRLAFGRLNMDRVGDGKESLP